MKDKSSADGEMINFKELADKLKAISPDMICKILMNQAKTTSYL